MPSEVAPGTILDGKYRVERVLGRGGMGMVVSALHLRLGERVAIKFLLPEMLADPEVVERFAREARAAVKIKSEYVARVVDVGTLDTGAPYLVMEYLEGEDLAARLKRAGPISVVQAVEFVLQASEALAEAHALGIVHRDIKPANLFCVRRADGIDSVKVLDFGISKGTSPGELRMTKTAAVMGSPLYMAPEQMRSSKSADAQSDVWSMGVVLFELLSGYVPFQGETFAELVVTVTGNVAPDVHALGRGVPDGLKQVVLRCLERDRARRYRSFAELAVALVPFGPPGRAQSSAERIVRVAHEAQNPSRELEVASPFQVASAAESAAGLGAAVNTRGAEASAELTDERAPGPHHTVMALSAPATNTLFPRRRVLGRVVFPASVLLALTAVLVLAWRAPESPGDGPGDSADSKVSAHEQADEGAASASRVRVATEQPLPAPPAPTAVPGDETSTPTALSATTDPPTPAQAATAVRPSLSATKPRPTSVTKSFRPQAAPVPAPKAKVSAPPAPAPVAEPSPSAPASRPKSGLGGRL